MSNEVLPEARPRRIDPVALDELHQVCCLLVVQLVVGNEAELDGGGDDAFLEVRGVETEPVLVEFDDVVVARHVVGLRHRTEDTLRP